MVPRSLVRSLRSKSITDVLASIPSKFCLGKGHVTFFYDKGAYLRKRYEQLKHELIVRGYNFDTSSMFDPDGVYCDGSPWNGNYTPTPSAIDTITSRINERIQMKPDWYRKSAPNHTK